MAIWPTVKKRLGLQLGLQSLEETSEVTEPYILPRPAPRLRLPILLPCRAARDRRAAAHDRSSQIHLRLVHPRRQTPRQAIRYPR